MVLCEGQELAMDSHTVGSCGLHNRAALNVVESPAPNRFTLAPSEYRQDYEKLSFAWMFSQAVRGAREIAPVSMSRLLWLPGSVNCVFASRHRAICM